MCRDSGYDDFNLGFRYIGGEMKWFGIDESKLVNLWDISLY